MSRIEQTFAALKRPALITFIMAGDPDSRTSLAIMKALPEAGADIIELGMPFTDPMADGPTIQLAGIRALEAGQTMKRTLHIVKHFRETNDKTPVVLMGYFNPVFQYGLEQFMHDASAAGVDGLILVDLPPEESTETIAAAKEKNIDIIRLLTPTTDEARLPHVLKDAGGFLYYVSVAGVTGSASADLGTITPHIAQIKKLTNLPIAIGFGIKTPADAAAMGKIGDAIVVGSAIINNIFENADKNPVSAVEMQVRSLADALR
ncbi:MAG: tryptophan synthase subunit alpha [Alphaproteobacteria bacterium]|nr:tryptophan synthase subunit alpha [Alphaproteobacteria bacterium]